MAGQPTREDLEKEFSATKKNLTEENRRLTESIKRLHRQLQSRQAGEAYIINAVQECYRDPPDLKIPPPPPKSRKKEKETAVLHVTDTQIGKVTDSFSIEIADARLLRLAKKVIQITETRRNSAAIDEILILLGGDMVEGELIFPSQVHEIDQSVFDQSCRDAPAILARMILQLIEAFPRVRVSAVCGNHGRTAPRISPSHPRTSWDRVCYEMLKVMLLGSEDRPRAELRSRLTIEPSEIWYVVENVYDWGLLLVHGDQMKGGFAGFPWYSVGKKAWGWIDAIPEDWDYLYMGHFHQYASATLNLRTFFCSGSVESGNVYAQENLAAAGLPCQRLQFFNAEHGQISDSQIFLTGEGERLSQRQRGKQGG